MSPAIETVLHNLQTEYEREIRRVTLREAERMVAHDEQMATAAAAWRERLEAERRRSGLVMAAIGLGSFSAGALLATAAWWWLR